MIATVAGRKLKNLSIMKKVIGEKAMQIANSFMPFITIGVHQSAFNEVRDSIAQTVQSAMETYWPDLKKERDELLDALKKVVANPSILSDNASAYQISKKFPVTPEVQAKADKYAEIISLIPVS